MRQHKQTEKGIFMQTSISVALIFLLLGCFLLLVEKTTAVSVATGTNATITLFDDGDLDPDRRADNKTPGIEVNNLFNDSTNVTFYANYTNASGSSMQPIAGTACAIEFETGAGGTPGPFTMQNNATTGMFEYKRTFPNNGTFIWNATCGNTVAGTANVTVYDAVRIFGPGCTTPSTSTLPNSITNNTILCGAAQTITPGAGSNVFRFDNNNITLDCNGSIFRGANLQTGININAFNGTIIKNCGFENYTDAVVRGPGTNFTNLLLYNNSFANLTTTGINISDVINATLRSNNFTNISKVAVFGVNITNFNITLNKFCQNNIQLENVSGNARVINNTLCVTLISPANNTDQNEINFTFNVPTFNQSRTCNLVTNVTTDQGGRVIVALDATGNTNVTLNGTVFAGDMFNWGVNCTDSNGNGEDSIRFNSTYRACSVPTVAATITARNVTLCPGRYELNTTTTTALRLNGVAGGILCNNTIIVGNSSTTAAVRIFNVASDAQLRHCHIIGYATGVDVDTSGPDRTIIHNNTFENISSVGIIIRNISNMNITNNTFSNVGQGLRLLNTIGHSIDNNIFYNVSIGLLLDNSTGLNIRNNNFSNFTGNGIQMNVTIPLVNRTLFNYTIAGNYFCGIRLYALSLVDLKVSTDINGTVPANTFCGSTSANPNGGIGRVSWTVEVTTSTNAGPLSGSFVYADTHTPRSRDTEGFTNDSGIARFVLQEFNISADNTVTQRTPHKIVGNNSKDTKSLIIIINKTRLITLGSGLSLNLSDPDTVSSGKKSASLFKPKMSGIKGAAPAAAAPAAPSSGDSDDEEEEKKVEEKVEVVEEIKEYGYDIGVETVYLNDEIIYEHGIQTTTLVFKDYEQYTLVVVLKNNETGNITDLTYTLEFPEAITLVSSDVDKKIIEEDQTARVTFLLESENIEETFMFGIKITSKSVENIAIDLQLSTILEAGKGNLYYTRQKIIEETKEVIIRTYKILFLLFLIPILLLLRMTTITDEKAIRSLIEQKKLGDYWKVYVSESVYPKYNMFENVTPLVLEEEEQKKATALAQKEKITYELATLVLFGNKKLIPRVFTLEEISKELKHKYPRILFTSPLRNFKEDQLQRYVETQVAKGHTHNEIREVLLGAGWKKEIVKRFLDPEKDLDKYVIEQKEKGKSLGEVRKILLDAKWSKEIVDTHVPKEMVIKEYIDVQRKKGVSNSELRKQLISVGWEKELVQKYLNPENDLKTYIVSQQHKGISNEELKKKLLQKGWKKYIVEKYVKK